MELATVANRMGLSPEGGGVRGGRPRSGGPEAELPVLRETDVVLGAPGEEDPLQPDPDVSLDRSDAQAGRPAVLNVVLGQRLQRRALTGDRGELRAHSVVLAPSCY